MSRLPIHTLVDLRRELSQAKYSKGELSGNLALNTSALGWLRELAEMGVIDDMLEINGTSISLDKVAVESGKEIVIPVTLYTQRIPDASYYEDLTGFVQANQQGIPQEYYYIHELRYFSDQLVVPIALAQFDQLNKLVSILEVVADFVQEEVGEPHRLILFSKRKVVIPIIFHRNELRNLNFVPTLEAQLLEMHDKEERRAIFKNELVTALFDVEEDKRFSKLLESASTLYDQYLKSHLLYLEKFSYHDLKSQVDKDTLEYTKKIYGTVNDIQAKLIAVPAAFLLVLTQFDFTGIDMYKNSLIGLGAILFSVLLEILLTNQFGVLNYLKKEIFEVNSTLKNKDTEVDLNQFIQSFGALEPLIVTQRRFLWLFRVITWLVPIIALVMLVIAYYKKSAYP